MGANNVTFIASRENSLVREHETKNLTTFLGRRWLKLEAVTVKTADVVTLQSAENKRPEGVEVREETNVRIWQRNQYENSSRIFRRRNDKRVEQVNLEQPL